MKSKKVLLAGETWISRATHIKGFDEFSSTTYHNGAEHFLKAAAEANINVEQLPAHEVPNLFPRSIESLNEYSAVILSDIGSNSLLLSNSTWIAGNPMPNVIELLVKWVKAGGSLMMAGGYMSFQGFQGIANFANTVLPNVLPVRIQNCDDRIECPQGYLPKIVKNHQIVKGITSLMPPLLGYNKVKLKPKSELIMTINDDPLLVVSKINKGRSLVWTSDIGPHWCPPEFISWPGYNLLVQNMLSYLIEGVE
jgi:uncharacterized membrane protein